MSSKSDISNHAIRIFLTRVGNYYDKARGFEPFIPNANQKKELLTYFDYECCYCGSEIKITTLSKDHLVPINKHSMGLHAWGNIVPSCSDCNKSKHQKEWEEFIKEKCEGKVLNNRKRKIQSFIKLKKYNPNLKLHKFAENLYKDVGEVSETLIKLRYNQAEDSINKLLKK